MTADEIILVDATGGEEVSTKSEGSVVDEKKEEFRGILKNTAMKKNVDNITEGFFRGDTTDREYLAEVLSQHRVTPDNINAIFFAWFNEFPEDCDIDINRSRRNKVVKDDGAGEIDFAKDVGQKQEIAMRRELNMLSARKAKLELEKDIAEFKDDGAKKTEMKERIEPVMIMGDDGQIEVAKDVDGAVITKKIVEPIGTTAGGSNMTEMMMMQQIMGGNNRNNGSSGMTELKVQNLENEIVRNNDRYESEMNRLRDKLEGKDSEIARMREDKNSEVARIREDKNSEIAALKEKHDDKMEAIKEKCAVEMKHAEDRWVDKESYYVEKVDGIDRDFREQVEGLRSKHEENLTRMHDEHRHDTETFVDRADDNLEAVRAIHGLQVTHRDAMEVANAARLESEKAMENKINEWKNMSDTDRSTTRMIEAASGGINKLFDVFGRPVAANMQTQAMATQQLLREQEIARLRNEGYADDAIVDMVQPAAPNYDDAYEQVLDDEPEPIPVSVPVPPAPVHEQTVEVPQQTRPIMVTR